MGFRKILLRPPQMISQKNDGRHSPRQSEAAREKGRLVPNLKAKVVVPYCLSLITSVLSERPLKSADQKTERSKVINPQYSIDRDQPTSRASPLRINTLLSDAGQNSLLGKRNKQSLGSCFTRFQDRIRLLNCSMETARDFPMRKEC